MIDETVQEQEVVQEPIEKNEEQTVEQPQQEKMQEKPQEKSWRELREKAERLEKERDEALRYAQEVQKKQKPQESDSEEFSVNPDELVEGKHLSKVQKKISNLEKELQKYQQQSQESSVELKLKSSYPDFDKVVTEDTLKMLKDSDPELAESINYNPNLFNKATAAYKAIKKMGIYKEDNYEQDRELAQRNASKPKPLASISPQQGDTPLSRANAFANGLTKELKEQLRKEMEEARKNL